MSWFNKKKPYLVLREEYQEAVGDQEFVGYQVALSGVALAAFCTAFAAGWPIWTLVPVAFAAFALGNGVSKGRKARKVIEQYREQLRNAEFEKDKKMTDLHDESWPSSLK